jgi:hypothetical protein
METKELVNVQTGELSEVDHSTLNLESVKSQVNLIQHVLEHVMKENEHYGRIPGCGDKQVLLKAGAEKLCLTFRMAPEYREEIIDLGNGHREYRIQCRMIHIPTGNFLGAGVGSASTMESKFRYRSEWVDGKKAKIEHPDIADVYNTVFKMAKKRALVDASLTCTAASDIFTQDLEESPPQESPIVAMPKPKSQAVSTPHETTAVPPAPVADGKTFGDPEKPASEKQKKMIWAVCQKGGIHENDLKAFMFSNWQISTSKDLKNKHVNPILAWVKSLEAPGA